MADLSKKQLSEKALSLGAQLGVEVKTDGLNHPALTALVSDLEGKAKEKARAAVVLDGTEVLPPDYNRPTVEEFVAKGYQAENYEKFFADYERGLLVDAVLAKQAPTSPSSEDSSASTDEAGPRRYILAQNKGLTCFRGILGEGEEVFAVDLGVGGAERLVELDESGHFVK